MAQLQADIMCTYDVPIHDASRSRMESTYEENTTSHKKAHVPLRPQLHKDTTHIHVPILDTSKVTSPTAYRHNNTSHFHTHSQSKAHGRKSSSCTDSTCTSVFISMTHEDLVAPTTFRQDATTYIDKSHQAYNL
mgnify:CR=1 FL=1